MITHRSFEDHVRWAEQTSGQLRSGQLDEGWATTLQLNRQTSRHGLHIETQ
jgi:hypothetical protein